MTDFVSHSADLTPGSRFPWIADGFALGGDYSPEQWPESVWVEDIALMRRAGVNSLNVGVFSWGLLETSDGVFDWGWLDRILDLLAEARIGDAVGYGLFEHGTFGRHLPSGFADFGSVAE